MKHIHPETRHLICQAAVSLCMAASAIAPAHAQKFPDKPVRLVVPFAAGGGTDVLARDLAPRLGEALGQPVIIDNRGGAGGNIGSDIVAKSTPDGYTILFGSNALSINAALYKNLPFDAMTSLAAIGTVATAPLVLVTNAEVPITSVKALIAEAKANPSKMNWSTPGNGTPHHLAEELFNKMTGANLTHVQYKGGGPAINDLLGKQTQASILTFGSVKPFIDSGKLRPIGVATATRTALMPNVPTIAEAGVPGYQVELWYGIFAPAATPPRIVQALNDALNKVLTDKAVQQRFADQGYEAKAGTPGQLGDLLKSDLARSARIIADAGITLE